MKKISILIVLIAIIAAFFYFWQGDKQIEPQNLNSGGNTISVLFQFSEDDQQEIDFEFKQALNLVEITDRITVQENWEFEFEDYGDMGILVNQIGDKSNGQNNSYWQYFVDSEQPQISADKYFPNDKDYIEWKFIESEF